MKKLQSCLTTAVLLAAVVIGCFCLPMKGAQRGEENAVQGPGQSTGRLAVGSRSLVNGVYAVLSESLTRAAVQTEREQQVVLVYDGKSSEADKDRRPRYVAIDTSSFVPLILASPPTAEKDDRGWTMLNVSLASQHVKTLEDFTRAHLDGMVATVIDGEIITMHKVRAVIKDGKARLTRCSDDACTSLFLKLTK